MDFYQRIRNFLGLTPHSNKDQDIDQSTAAIWKKDNSFGDRARASPDQYDSFGFNIFTSPLEMHRYFEHQMNEMLKNFGIFTNDDSFFGSFGGPSLPGENPFGHNDGFQFPTTDEFDKDNEVRSSNLRDQYLKPGYEMVPNGQRKVDKDVDHKFNLNELDTVLKSGPVQVQPKRFFYGQSVMTKTIRNADGTLESHRTVRDQEGNEETVVTKRHGDKEYSVTTKRNKDGAQEVIENMVNLDEKEKESFLKKEQKIFVEPDLKHPPNDFPYDKFF